MGDRSNINIITEKCGDGNVQGLNLYSHNGGVYMLIEALEIVQKELVLPDEKEYFSAGIIGKLIQYPNDNRWLSGFGLSPFVDEEDKARFKIVLDNDNPVLTFDLPNRKIYISVVKFNGERGAAGYPLDATGLKRARGYLLHGKR